MVDSAIAPGISGKREVNVELRPAIAILARLIMRALDVTAAGVVLRFHNGLAIQPRSHWTSGSDRRHPIGRRPSLEPERLALIVSFNRVAGFE